MAGRHHGAHASTARRSHGRPTRTAVVAIVLVLLAVGGLSVVARQLSSRTSAAESQHTCTDRVSLSVIAAPAIAPALSNLTAAWTASKPVIDGSCVSAEVHTALPAVAISAMGKAAGVIPDLWIPDSSLWLQRLQEETDNGMTLARSVATYPALARTPLVLATSAATATRLQGRAAAGWPAVLSGAAGGDIAMSIADPTSSTEGLLTLLAAQSALGTTDATPSKQLRAALVGLSRSVVPNPVAALGTLSQHPDAVVAVPASEQQVALANRAADTASPGASSGAASARAVALIPRGKLPVWTFRSLSSPLRVRSRRCAMPAQL